MKRDWKLIRAILCGESTDGWEDGAVVEHAVLCAEAGYTHAVVSQSVHGNALTIIYTRGPERLTVAGREMADVLANAEDLAAVLAQLDAAGVGHTTDIVVELMKRRSRERVTWGCIGHKPTTWALGTPSSTGCSLSDLVALVSRCDDGCWNWYLSGRPGGREPSRELAMQAAEAAVTSDRLQPTA
jgi:hypothetical protein